MVVGISVYLRNILFCFARVIQGIGPATVVPNALALVGNAYGMDMSFPSATILLSNNTPSHNQGLASSLVNTAVNYSISLGLGIAGTVLRNVNPTGMDILAGYRGAWYFGIGLDVLAVVIALYFVWKY